MLDLYRKKFANINIINAKDENENNLFYQVSAYRKTSAKLLKFLYDYAINRCRLFREKYSEHDIYYFMYFKHFKFSKCDFVVFKWDTSQSVHFCCTSSAHETNSSYDGKLFIKLKFSFNSFIKVED